MVERAIMKPTMARERRAIGKSILEKKKWLKEQLSGLFITKSLNLQAEECTFKPRVNIIIFMHLSTVPSKRVISSPFSHKSIFFSKML